MLVALDRGDVAGPSGVGGVADLLAGSPLAEEVPALVERFLQVLQPFGVDRAGAAEPMLLVHQGLDPSDEFVVAHARCSHAASATTRVPCHQREPGHDLAGLVRQTERVRADRLVAILLMLQARGHVTAGEVAEELEISERTARRDLDALGMAGLPVYSVQGRNGGWRLAGDGRTDLTGLTVSEARALFLVAGPASTATPDVKAALRKLLRALPEPLRESAAAASSAIHVDPVGWNRSSRAPTPPHLDALQQAVVEARQIGLGYVARDGSATTRVAHPLGLATKGTIWYLVADTAAGLRTFRVDRVTSVEMTEDAVVRPADFELAEAWKLIVEGIDELRAPVRARAWVTPEMLPILRVVFGTRIRIGPPGPDGRVEVDLRGHREHVLAAEIAGFGRDVEVIEPAEVRAELASIAAELTELYP